MRRIVTLLTDFGTADGYVGEMKGVLCAGAPGVAIVDMLFFFGVLLVGFAYLWRFGYLDWVRSAATTSLKVDYQPGIDLSRAARVEQLDLELTATSPR